ncbi:hypothetical protein GCM10011352_20150 [Marinobacterium zhoushanense]|uniref:Raffinose porin n=1 Tax=Marinobacterium zhoushanense TaxID=1679163 RepID=A0ABQ1KF13_9GAMM|nr:carbohydrate porin [Marinobacterium zhoushanense]GGB94074.1 hypothetical protein GCM10011352_20150 [Marinobacterium zhoushanense]
MNKNKSRFVKHILCAAVVAVMAAPAMAELSFDANIELNTDATDTETTDTTYDQDGRVEVNAFGRHEKGNYFVQARGTVLLKTDGDTAVDDAWIQFGDSTWDVQAGRFEAVNLFPKGKDTLISHAGGVSVYEANLARGRVGDGGGQFALHLNSSENLRFELGTIFGDGETTDGDDTTAFGGVRPTVTWSSGDFSLTAGYERVNYDLTAGGDVDKQGYALTSSFKAGGADVNLAVSHLEDDSTGADEEVTSYIANMIYGNFGAGLIYSEDELAGVDSDVTTAYLAYTVPLFDFENASVTFAGSFSQADGDAVTDDTTNALRMRFNYTF